MTRRSTRTRHLRLLASALLAGLIVVVAAPAKTVRGTDGADVLRGTSGNDKLYGKGGADRLFGLRGNDLLVGGLGADLLIGGSGDDRLDARDGVPDFVRCGPGTDTAIVDHRERVLRSCEKVLRPPPSASTFVIAGAGDISGSGSGDYETARLLDRIEPDVVFTTGDNVYPDGKLSEFQVYYAPSWGRWKSSTRPSPGNHAHHTPGAAGYFRYFGSRVPGPYYSYDVGNWHLISLDTELPVEKGSPQYEWLKEDLAASDAACTLAYWHKPRFTSGKYDDFRSTKPLWDLLYGSGAELVLGGHDHNYQRYAPLDPSGNADAERGIRQFVVGTGGRSLYGVKPDARRERAFDDAFGVLQLTLRPNGYQWRFIPVSGSYSDTGSASCR